MTYLKAREVGLILCLDCRLLLNKQAITNGGRCPRCGARVHLRKPNSLARTWALLITSLIFLFPANMLPIMTVTYLGQIS